MKPGNIRLGFSTYGMKDLPVDRALQVIADAGYTSVELAAMPDWPSEPRLLDKSSREKLRKQLDGGLTLDAMMLNIRPEVSKEKAQPALRELRETAQLGRDLTGGNCPPIETVLGGRPDQWDELKEQIAAGLEHWAKLAEEENFIIAIKGHVSGAMSTPERAEWMRQQLGAKNIKFAYDYSHFGLQDLSLEESMRTMLPHTVFIHIKDYVRKEKGFQFVLPGETDFDYHQYFRLLNRFGYSGAVCVEVSGQVFNKPGYDPIAACKFCYERLSGPFAKSQG